MLKDAAATYVIIGHSERRQYFGETNEIVRQKIEAALRTDLKPIVCIGETLREREGGKTLPVIERQVRDGLAGFSREVVRGLVIAYEPVWAIGTGRTATPEQARRCTPPSARWLRELAGETGGEAVRILYGGSVKADNIDALMAQPDIDGALVGGASLEAESFSRIIAFRDRKAQAMMDSGHDRSRARLHHSRPRRPLAGRQGRRHGRRLRRRQHHHLRQQRRREFPHPTHHRRGVVFMATSLALTYGSARSAAIDAHAGERSATGRERPVAGGAGDVAGEAAPAPKAHPRAKRPRPPRMHLPRTHLLRKRRRRRPKQPPPLPDEAALTRPLRANARSDARACRIGVSHSTASHADGNLDCCHARMAEWQTR